MGSGIVSPGHLIIVLVIMLLVFGPKRLPELGRSVGRGMREFRDSIGGSHDSDDEDAAPATPPIAPPMPAPDPAARQPDPRAQSHG
jgi:sec-independent protein translocase protein TatA